MSSETAARGTRPPVNQVHHDNNWRQRVTLETNTEPNWRANWGFLDPRATEQMQQAAKRPSYAALDAATAAFGPCYQFATTLKQDQWRNRSQVYQTDSSSSSSPSTPSSSASSSAAHGIGGEKSRLRMNQLRSNPLQASRSLTQMPALSSTRQWDQWWDTDDSSLSPTSSSSSSASASSASAPWTGPSAGRLDVTTATAMQPKILQAVGATLALPGVDPNVKYSFPQTATQQIGWRATQSLELFGVAHHGKRGLNWNDFR